MLHYYAIAATVAHELMCSTATSILVLERDRDQIRSALSSSLVEDPVRLMLAAAICILSSSLVPTSSHNFFL